MTSVVVFEWLLMCLYNELMLHLMLAAVNYDPTWIILRYSNLWMKCTASINLTLLKRKYKNDKLIKSTFFVHSHKYSRLCSVSDLKCLSIALLVSEEPQQHILLIPAASRLRVSVVRVKQRQGQPQPSPLSSSDAWGHALFFRPSGKRNSKRGSDPKSCCCI